MPEADFVEFAVQLDNIPQDSIPMATRMLGKSLQAVESIISVYPAQPDRNRAKTFNNYVRGVGRVPMSGFRTAKFVARKRVQTKNATRTSQRLDTRFRMLVQPSEAGVEGVLENTASYSGWVIGQKEGDPHQTDPHKQTGWIDADTAIDQATPQIDRFADELMSEILDELAK